MWRHLSQIYFPNLFYKNLGLDKEMHTSKLTKCFTLSVISDYHLVRWSRYKFMQFLTLIFACGCIDTQAIKQEFGE